MKGVYGILINVKQNINVNVGALGNIYFEKGVYVYVGSGQNNLEKRVSRHMRKEKKLHWHIDYLLNNKHVIVESAYCCETNKKTDECKLAMLMKPAAPIINFGCSDCKCNSHLFRL